MFDVYVEVVSKSDLGKLPDHVKHTPAALKPQLAKKLTDDLVAALTVEEQSLSADHPAVSGKPTVVEAMTRVAVALKNGLLLDQVVACLTEAKPRSCRVRALSLLLGDCAIESSGPVDLLSWTLCIGESISKQEWTQLGESLALDCKQRSNGDLLRRWLSAMTSLADQVQSHHPTASDFVLALLNGFDGAFNLTLDLNLNVDVPDPLVEAARVKCDRLRAQLTHEAERLVTELDTAVRKANALANEDIAQPAEAEQRKRPVRDDSQVNQLCSDIVDGLARGVLTLKEVIDALEQLATGSKTVAALMHVLVVRARSKEDELHAFFRTVLDEAARPDELVLCMAPALLDGGGDISLAAALVYRLAREARLAGEAARAFTRLLPILRLIEALCLLVEGSSTLLLLREHVNGMVRDAAVELVTEASQCVGRATDRLFEARKLEPTARLTPDQLEGLGGVLKDSIEALARPLNSPMASAYVVEALRSSIHLPACGHLVSLLVRGLLERQTVLDVFMGVLVNAEVPPTASNAHRMLAWQVALGVADWALPGPSLVKHVDAWIDAVKPDASAMGFGVLQVILDSLASIKWRSSIKSDLVERLNQVEKRMRARRAEPHMAPVIELIASTRGAKECSLVEDKEEVLKNGNINGAVNGIVLAVRSGDISMGEVIEWFSGQKATFDRDLLLFTFIGPLFGESVVSKYYNLKNFLSTLLDVDDTKEFFSEVGVVFGVREESDTDRKSMIDTIEALSIQCKDDKLLRLHWFASEYLEASNEEDARSKKLSAVIDAIGRKLDGEEASQTAAAEQDIPSQPTEGMQPGAYSQSVIESSNPVPEAGPPSNSGPIDFGIRDQRTATPPVVANPPRRPELPAGRIPPQQGPIRGLILPTWLPLPHSEGNHFSSYPGPQLIDGLPIHYSLAEAPPEDNTRIIPIPPRTETHTFAKRVVKALNDQQFSFAKRLIMRAGSKVLNLTGPGVPRLEEKGLETLGRIISDPEVDLRELALGEVARGIRHVIGAIEESKHLEVLNLYSFVGWGLDDQGRVAVYKFHHALEHIVNLYPSQSMPLQRLVVSNETISAHESEPMLARLETVSGGRLKVERRN
ncbi:hypothetical protein [Variovorax sp. RA8]|uniref:hypothetical protein n=1 Tax=Variovorax sp. (strain JCM 16519 / RA8) TaxID=662548 RepID=UPI0013A53C3E|nr:hypothetical protein [Variovorax sp. RA8]